MSYHSDYPTIPTEDPNNPYYMCAHCQRTDPQINGEIKNHAEWCEYRLKKERTLLPLQKYQQRLEDYVDMKDIPEALRDRIYESACGAEQEDLIDYSDGDFYYIIDFVEVNFPQYGRYPWLKELMDLLPDEVIARNMFAVWFYQ